MTPQGYAARATAMVAVLVAVVVFAALRSLPATRDSRARSRDSDESALWAALQEASRNCARRERALTERAQASERLKSL